MRKISLMILLILFFAQVVRADEWYEKLKFKGDFRYRFQNEWLQSDDQTSNLGKVYNDYRERQRIRLRFGFDMPVNDKVKVGVRLATKGDPRSTNQTLGDTTPFDQRGIMIDQAYLAYTPWDEFTFTAGKFAAPFYQVTDLIWDTDINFEGYSGQYKSQITDTVQVFVNAGQFQLKEINDMSTDYSQKPDPFLNWWQPGVHWDITDEWSMDAAIANWNFQEIRENTQFLSTGKSNTTSNVVVGATTYTTLADDFNVSNPVLKLTYKVNPDFAISVFEETVANAGANSGASGECKGFTFGSFKVANQNDWQVTYLQKRLGADAFPDMFPDSDSYGGYTDIQGQKLNVQYCLAENTTLAFSSYTYDRIDQTYHNPWNLLQYDLQVKF